MTNAPVPPPAPAYQPPAAERTNTFAIVSIIVVWFFGLLGLIFGYVALSQIKRTGEGGRGLALAAVIIGWIGIAVGIVWGIIAIVFAVIAVQNGVSVNSY